MTEDMMEQQESNGPPGSDSEHTGGCHPSSLLKELNVHNANNFLTVGDSLVKWYGFEANPARYSVYSMNNFLFHTMISHTFIKSTKNPVVVRGQHKMLKLPPSARVCNLHDL